MIESFAKNARTGIVATLGKTRDDRQTLLDDARTKPHRFKVLMRSEMRPGRKARGRSLGFIGSVLRLINGFYGDVVQAITPWQQPTPKLESAAVVEQSDDSPERY